MGTDEPRSTPPESGDPFEGHLAFLGDLAKRGSVGPSPDPDRLVAVARPLNTRADRMGILDGALKLATWHGLSRPPRVLTDEDMPQDVTAALSVCEAQFHLRNIGRAERSTDPEEPLPFEGADRKVGLDAAQEAQRALGPYEPPAMVDIMNLEVVRQISRRTRWLWRRLDWGGTFGREITEDLDGPVWRHAPDDEVSPSEEPQDG